MHSDVRKAVELIIVRVKEMEKDEWESLKKLLKYLKGTRAMNINLTVESLYVIIWWVDTSYSAQDYFKCNIVSMMLLGKAAIVCFLRKQKINGKNSTEEKIIGFDDDLLIVLC